MITTLHLKARTIVMHSKTFSLKKSISLICSFLDIFLLVMLNFSFLDSFSDSIFNNVFIKFAVPGIKICLFCSHFSITKKYKCKTTEDYCRYKINSDSLPFGQVPTISLLVPGSVNRTQCRQQLVTVVTFFRELCCPSLTLVHKPRLSLVSRGVK